ncbi:unnamed protein product [Citrullus colocynthis]|uniref:Uncharacterized protein n=1 Tax=Citrullus colocynthis TaxID=252529 RepID=A0ABP0YN14_9ROSI
MLKVDAIILESRVELEGDCRIWSRYRNVVGRAQKSVQESNEAAKNHHPPFSSSSHQQLISTKLFPFPSFIKNKTPPPKRKNLPKRPSISLPFPC